jgi:hypothetical protein
MRGKHYLEAVMCTRIAVDGRDANEKLAQMVNCSRYREQIRLIMLDGVALGGFNVVDLERLHSDTGKPVLTVTRDPPDLDSMVEALRAHFADWEARWALIRKCKVVSIKTRHKPAYITHVGIDLETAVAVIDNLTVRGVLPEPIRVAHLIACALASGESRGRP